MTKDEAITRHSNYRLYLHRESRWDIGPLPYFGGLLHMPSF